MIFASDGVKIMFPCRHLREDPVKTISEGSQTILQLMSLLRTRCLETWDFDIYFSAAMGTKQGFFGLYVVCGHVFAEGGKGSFVRCFVGFLKGPGAIGAHLWRRRGPSVRDVYVCTYARRWPQSRSISGRHHWFALSLRQGVEAGAGRNAFGAIYHGYLISPCTHRRLRLL